MESSSIEAEKISYRIYTTRFDLELRGDGLMRQTPARRRKSVRFQN